MKLYLFSLGAGVLVGLIYHLMGVRSPAPPLVALVGLLGILGGEQLGPIARQYFSAVTLARVTEASDKTDAASATLHPGISGSTAASKTAGNGEARS